jgi:heme-degrading monooxygenase HmoA
MADTVFLVVWEFRVTADAEVRFEQIYSSAGAWAALFSRDPAFLRTELQRDLREPSRYLTLDYWRSESSYDQFHDRHRADYNALDRECESLTESETLVGRFVLVP